MTRNESGEPREGSAEPGAVSNSSSSEERGAPARRPYQKPVLRRLGSVRELTLGSTMGKLEGGGSLMTTM
jgi:hypothetical protein